MEGAEATREPQQVKKEANKMAEEKEEKVERLPSTLTAQMLSGEEGLFLNVARFEHAQRVAKMLAESTMVPDHFRGNVGNCLIAINLAQRMRLDVFMLMQSIYVVHGRPGIEGKLVIALIEGHGRFGPLHFKFSGEGLTGQKIKRAGSCIAYAVDLKTKETITGPEVTWDMVVAEGWNKAKGEKQTLSKWETMPELMFIYRTASFFGRVHDPGALMGFRSLEEVEETEEVNITPQPPFSSKETDEINKKAKLEKFFTSWPADASKKLVDEFLKRTAEANRVSVEEGMVLASDDLPRFWELFAKFAEKKKKEAKREKGDNVTSPETEQSSAAPNPLNQERQTAEPLSQEKKQKENEISGVGDNASALDRVRFIEKTYPKLFKAACEAAGIPYPLTEEGAMRVRNEAIKLFRAEENRK